MGDIQQNMGKLVSSNLFYALFSLQNQSEIILMTDVRDNLLRFTAQSGRQVPSAMPYQFFRLQVSTLFYLY